MFVLQYFYRKIKWIFWNSLFWKVLNLSKLKWNSLKHVVHVKNSTLIPESNVFKAWDKIPPLQCGILSQDRNAFLYLLLQRFTPGQRFATPLSVRGGFLFCFFFTLQLYLTCGLSFYLLVYFSFIGTISLLIMTDGKALCVCVPFPPKIPFSNSVCSQVCKQIWLGLYDDRTSSVPDFREPQKVKEFLQDKYEKKRWYVSIISLLRKDLCQCALCKGFFLFFSLSLWLGMFHMCLIAVSL